MMDLDTEFGNDLMKQYGPLIGGNDLVKVLGYRTNSSFRRAIRMGLLGVNVFDIPDRKGKFAFTKDVVIWLANLTANKTKGE